MRTTIDTQTGRTFRWNATDVVAWQGVKLRVPARYGVRTATHLHPARVQRELLARLNPGVALPEVDSETSV